MKLTALPGYAIVELHGMYDEGTGLIQIPERYRAKRQVIGTIVQASPREIDTKALGMNIEEGQTHIMAYGRGRRITKDLYVFPLTFPAKDWQQTRFRDSGLLGLLPDGMEIGPVMMEIPRCQYCGNARDVGERQGMMLVESNKGMICPRCNRTEYGEKIDPDEVEVTQSEVDDWDEAYGQKKARGTVYSTPSSA